MSDSFTIDEENFICWTGCLDDQQFYPIHVYNMSQKKKHQIIQKSRVALNILAFYCKSSGEDILYSGDDDGDLRIFLLDKTTLKFEERYIIHTKLAILEAIIIEDLFHESHLNLDNNKPVPKEENKELVIIAFTTKIPVRIYNFFGEIMHFIPEYHQELCGIINSYYDQSLLTTSIFLGFETCIRQFDWKSNRWIKEFHTKKPVNAIRFLLNFQKASRLIIYTQNLNVITITDIDTGNVIKELRLMEVADIFDICIWRSNITYLILAVKGVNDNNSIKILNLDDERWFYFKTKPKHCPFANH